MPTAIHCGTLIDGNGGDPLRNAVIVIEDGAITAINADGSIPAGAEVMDATGATVLPGLIDCHVHLGGDPTDSTGNYFEDAVKTSDIDGARPADTRTA